MTPMKPVLLAGLLLLGACSPAGTTSRATAPPPALPTVADLWRPQVIYLVMPDRFADGDLANDRSGNPGCFDPRDPRKSHGGDLAGLRRRIPYLAELGVTALWITPVYKEAPGGCGYHGYWADFTDPDDGAVDPTLGTVADLAALAADLHAAGMKLILDMVVNHAGRGARIVDQHPAWFHDPATCATLGDPTVYCPIGGIPLPDFAQEKPAVAAYLTATSVGWVKRAGLDGIRMDTVKHVPLDYWRGSWIPGVKAARSPLFTVGEVYDEGPPEHLAPYLAAGFDSLLDFPLRPALVGCFAGGGSVDPVAAKVEAQIAALGLPAVRMLTTFLDDHDVPRFASSAPAGASEEDTARGLHLALGALLTLPGIPQIYYGDELGMLGGKDPDNRRDMPAWAWSAAGRAAAHPGEALPHAEATFALTAKLIRIRKANAALFDGGYAELARQGGGEQNLLVFLRSAGDDRIVVAINNGARGTGRVEIPVRDSAALPDGTLLDDLLGEGAPAQVVLSGGRIALDLPARTMGIYRCRQRTISARMPADP